MIIKIKDKLAYIHAPKCASRTMLAWIAIINHPNLHLEQPKLFESSSFYGYYPLREYYDDLILNSSEYGHKIPPNLNTENVICVVRNPVDRFLSSYVNRVLFTRQLCGNKISISEYINNLDLIRRYNPDIYLHTQKQVEFYGKDPSVFTEIFSIPNLNLAKQRLEKTFGVLLPDLHLQQNNGLKHPNISKDQISFIKDFYKEDYEAYGQYF